LFVPARRKPGLEAKKKGINAPRSLRTYPGSATIKKLLAGKKIAL